MSLRRFAYTLLLYVIFPLVLLRLLWRSWANPDYRKRWSERLGFFPKNITASNTKLKPVIWLHAVSVGEAIAAKPLVQELFDKFPSHCVLMTTTTPTGSDRVKSMFSDEIKNHQLLHVYFPYDLLGSVSRFINIYKPRMLIVVETEIWPNLYAKCYGSEIPVVMVNARLSKKSTDSYLKIKGLIAETLSKVNLIAVRSNSDAERFMALGASPKQIEEIGNIKYDISIDQRQLVKSEKYTKIINSKGKRKRLVLVAASTHEGEDTKILFVYKTLLKQFPDMLLVLVPRHPERFDKVYEACIDQLPDDQKVVKHSQYNHLEESDQQTIDVVLGDSMGEMQMWYALSDVVFIGGSLVETGGHNPLEATLFSVPVFSGPHMFNFDDIASELSSDGLMFLCQDEFELVNKLSDCLKDIILSNKQGSETSFFESKADQFMQQHRGVTARLIDRISKQMND